VPLQNRVTPFGEIVAVAGRGTMMGNRGVLHGERRNLVKQWHVRRWITCRLQWRGRKRTVMTPRRYTELFFLDEAATFAAGHRPCAECRNADYKRFRALWETCFEIRAGADAMDAVLHAERLDGKRKRTYRADIRSLPDGAYLRDANGIAHLVWHDALLAWGDAGYGARTARPLSGDVDVLTPPSIVEIIRAGYVPDVHPTVAS
jgi:hypothetical protein